MIIPVEAIYESGKLTLQKPLPLPENAVVTGLIKSSLGIHQEDTAWQKIQCFVNSGLFEDLDTFAATSSRQSATFPTGQIEPSFPKKSPDSLGEKFVELLQRHRQLEIQALQLQSEVEFALRMIQMEPRRNTVADLVANRLNEALQKFKIQKNAKEAGEDGAKG